MSRQLTNLDGRPVWIMGQSGGQAGSATDPTYTTTNNDQPVGYRQLTNTQLATVGGIGLTAAANPVSGVTGIPAGARWAVIQNNGTQAVRWVDDGTAPAVAVGQRIVANSVYPLNYPGDLNAIRLFREGDGAVLDILFYK